jgi:hypothetical protein
LTKARLLLVIVYGIIRKRRPRAAFLHRQPLPPQGPLAERPLLPMVGRLRVAFRNRARRAAGGSATVPRRAATA